jgi:hypothetical protein
MTRCWMIGRKIRRMRGPAITIFGVFFVALLAAAPEQVSGQALSGGAREPVATLLESIELSPNTVTEVNQDQFETFLAWAAGEHYNLFELLNLLILELEARNFRVRVSGEVIRESEERYDLGRSKLYVILPVHDIRYIEFGARVSGASHALDVFINKPYQSDFYGFGTLHEDTHFGFASVSLNHFLDAFGMRAKRAFFTFQVDYLHLYESEEIAIHLKRFPKPKREVFRAVRER